MTRSSVQAVISALLGIIGVVMVIIGWGSPTAVVGMLLLAISVAAVIYLMTVDRKRQG